MKSFPYARPTALAPDLWEIRGEWSNAFGRRMTVVRTPDGQLYVHNSIRLDPTDLEWLKSLGSVRGIIAPNKFHSSDAPWMAEQFPEAKLFVPSAKLAEFKSMGLAPLDVAKDFQSEPPGILECIPMRGTRIDESAFIHAPSRTLILCDLAMNMEDVFTGLPRVFMNWNKVGGRFGVTRLTKLAFARDKRALVASYRELLERDFDRVIVNHGAVLPTGGKALLAASVAEIFG